MLRISGLLCRASVIRSHDFLDVADPLVVDGPTMKNAIRLGRYYLNHAQAAYSVLPEDAMYRKAKRILDMLREKGLTEFDRREAMRYCRTFNLFTFPSQYYALSVTKEYLALSTNEPVLLSRRFK